MSFPSDRFIPQRHPSSLKEPYWQTLESFKPDAKGIVRKESVQKTIFNVVQAALLTEKLPSEARKERVLQFKSKDPQKLQQKNKALRIPYLAKQREEVDALLNEKVLTSIRLDVVKVLDAPNLITSEFAYHLIAMTKNPPYIFAIALADHLYLLNTEGVIGKVSLGLSQGDVISSISWLKDGKTLFIGTKNGTRFFQEISIPEEGGFALQSRKKEEGSFTVHDIEQMDSSLLAIATAENGSLLLEKEGREPLKVDLTQFGAKGFPISLCRSPLKKETLAIGMSSGQCLIVKVTSSLDVQLIGSFKLKDSVKAIAWHPSKENYIACGGGQKDPRIVVWDISTGKMVGNSLVNTGATVHHLHWLSHHKLLSTHGESSDQKGVARNNVLSWHVELNRRHFMQLPGITLSRSLYKESSTRDEEVTHFATYGDDHVIITGGQAKESVSFIKTPLPKAPKPMPKPSSLSMVLR